MECKSNNHLIVGFLSSFHSLHSLLTTTCLMQCAVAVMPIGTSYVEHGVKETIGNIGKCLLVVSGDALTVTWLYKVRLYIT